MNSSDLVKAKDMGLFFQDRLGQNAGFVEGF